MIKCLTQVKHKEERVYFSSQLEEHTIIQGDAEWQEDRVVGHISSTVMKQSGMNGVPYSLSS